MNIEVKDGLNASQMRQLIEITQQMVRLINVEEFNEILLVYGKATERLLDE